MPVINGRLHLPKQHLTLRQTWAYGVGVGAAVLFVAVGWWMTAGRPTLSTFASGIGSGVGLVADRAGAAGSDVAEAGSPGVDAARDAITDILKDAQAKKAAADIVAKTLKEPTP